MVKREIPPEVFRVWGRVFAEKKLDPQWSDELSELFYRLADVTEYNNILETVYRRENEETIH